MKAPPIHTRITELLGIRYPIIQGGMQWVGRASLAAAVSNAGGLGVLTALTQPTPSALGREIERCRQLTDKPFGVNISLTRMGHGAPYSEYIKAALDCGVTIFETAGNDPAALIPQIKSGGGLVIHKCTSIRHARSAQSKGADVLSIDGFECAGHPGEDDIGGLVLFPLARRQLSIPLVASGGISDGRGMAAALAMGMDGINMGTRFCATSEAPIHPAIKALLVNASERDTRLIYRSFRNTGRVLKTPVSEAVLALESRPQGCDFNALKDLVAGCQGRAALESGCADTGLVVAGQSVGLIDDLPSCAALIDTMVTECRSYLEAALSHFSPRPCSSVD